MLQEFFNPQYLKRLELLRIHSKRTYIGTRQGSHISLRKGHGIEFSDYRQYELGDSPRHIDWSVYARTDKLFVRRFREEEELSVLVVIDGSASLKIPAEDKKWERACRLGLSLGYIALVDQDTLRISVLGSFDSPKYIGPRAIHSAARSLKEAADKTNTFNFTNSMIQAASKVRFPGVAYLISDFLMPFEMVQKGVQALRAKNLSITALQVLGEHDVRPFQNDSRIIAIDSENDDEVELHWEQGIQGQYTKSLDAHNKKLRDFFHSHDISFAQLLPETDVEKFVTTQLPLQGVLT